MDSREMMEQASKTAHEYLTAAIKTVDEEFGEGAHQKYPEIVASLVQELLTDFLNGLHRDAVDIVKVFTDAGFRCTAFMLAVCLRSGLVIQFPAL